MRQRLSLGTELRLIAGAIDVIRAGVKRSESGLVVGALALVRDRVLLLEGVVRGTIDPARILCAENEAEPHGEVEGDLVVSAWSSAEQLSRADEAMKAAKARLDLEQRGMNATSTDFEHFRRDEVLPKPGPGQRR